MDYNQLRFNLLMKFADDKELSYHNGRQLLDMIPLDMLGPAKKSFEYHSNIHKRIPEESKKGYEKFKQFFIDNIVIKHPDPEIQHLIFNVSIAAMKISCNAMRNILFEQYQCIHSGTPHLAIRVAMGIFTVDDLMYEIYEEQAAKMNYNSVEDMLNEAEQL